MNTALATLHTDIDTTLLRALTSYNDAMVIADYYDQTNASPPLYSPNDQIGIAEYLDQVSQREPFFSSGDCLAKIMYDICQILTAVYDSGNGYLKTHETP